MEVKVSCDVTGRRRTRRGRTSVSAGRSLASAAAIVLVIALPGSWRRPLRVLGSLGFGPDLNFYATTAPTAATARAPLRVGTAATSAANHLGKAVSITARPGVVDFPPFQLQVKETHDCRLAI